MHDVFIYLSWFTYLYVVYLHGFFRGLLIHASSLLTLCKLSLICWRLFASTSFVKWPWRLIWLWIGERTSEHPPLLCQGTSFYKFWYEWKKKTVFPFPLAVWTSLYTILSIQLVKRITDRISKLKLITDREHFKRDFIGNKFTL